MIEKRDTVGAISSKLLLEQPASQDPIELQREMQEDYIKNLCECVEKHKNSLFGNFFIIVITKNERLMPNVFRNYFTARQTCPSPDYDQTVFRYNRQAEQIEFIWVIPSQDASHHLKKNAHLVVKEEQELLKFVLAFSDGTLYKMAKRFNGEKEDSIILEGN